MRKWTTTPTYIGSYLQPSSGSINIYWKAYTQSSRSFVTCKTQMLVNHYIPVCISGSIEVYTITTSDV